MEYNFNKIERKWQRFWRDKKIYEPNFKTAKKPFYNLMMFPYPSAEGLHVGNAYAFVGSDIYGRFKRMRGYDVFEPIGLDGFGIHSENYALKIGAHPAKQAKISEKRFYKQLESIGNGFSWDARLETYDPAYYKWTQWIFTQMFRNGLAYRKKAGVNWCPSCKTVLADEQVIGGPSIRLGAGKCERCSSVVVKKDLEQWFFGITKYADKLLNNLDKIDWSERVKIAQRNWIGKSEGAEIDFPLDAPPPPKEVVFASNNIGKLNRMRKLFKAAGLNFVLKAPEEIGIKSFDVVEDGETLRENAEKKARALAEKTNLPVFADDSGFFIDGVEIDPVAVKRNALRGADEKSLSVEEIAKRMQKYYRGIASSRGGRVGAEWRNALCFITPDGVATHVETIRPVILTNELHGKADPYLPLRGLYISKATGKYVLEQTEKEETEEQRPITLGIKKLFAPAIRVFTTRPDTIFGATYLVLAPEHQLLANRKSQIENRKEVEGYITKAKNRSEAERIAEGKDKTGVELKGVKAINPATKEKIPVWVADYVLSSYGTGAIMAVPAHDERDAEFAKKFNLLVSNAPLVPAEEAIKKSGGERKIQYRLRDWLISRQRYWGAPIPMIYCKKCSWQPVPEEDLPVKLQFVKDFRPEGKGESPLASVKSFYETKCPKCGGKARRETDVSDTFLDSAWYYIGYLIFGSNKLKVKSKKFVFNKQLIKNWLPVHMYIGGVEHSVLHLLYVRFLSLALHDLGLFEFGESPAPKGEPFPKFRAHGLLISEGGKMSKSKGNVVNPDEYIKKFGADVLRMYLMFLAPFEQGGDFRDAGILGVVRFLERVWRFYKNHKSKQLSPAGKRAESISMRWLYRAPLKITKDIESLKYNTAISALMISLNEMERVPQYVSSNIKETFLKLLAPFAPHITEEIWRNVLGNKESIHKSPWPEYDPKLIKEEEFDLVIQVNGKHRDTMRASVGISGEKAKRLALESARVKGLIGNKPIRKTIYVKDRLINFVI